MNTLSKTVLVAVGLAVLSFHWVSRSPSPSPQTGCACSATLYAPTALLPADAPAAVPSPTPTVTAPMPRLVDLGASRCLPCKMMTPVLDELKKEYAGRMQVDFFDV